MIDDVILSAKITKMLFTLAVSDIPETLRARGIRGYRRDSGRCPVACYLAECLGDDVRSPIDVTPHVVGVESRNGEVLLHVPVPLRLGRWIIEFDSGGWSEFDIRADEPGASLAGTINVTATLSASLETPKGG
jgi:hypothetical protein